MLLMWVQMEARLTKAEKEEIDRIKARFVLFFHFSKLGRSLLSCNSLLRYRKARGMTGKTTIPQDQATRVRIWVEHRAAGVTAYVFYMD
jgi:hypothetical protein